jgi:hypothetical protein
VKAASSKLVLLLLLPQFVPPLCTLSSKAKYHCSLGSMVHFHCSTSSQCLSFLRFRTNSKTARDCSDGVLTYCSGSTVLKLMSHSMTSARLSVDLSVLFFLSVVLSFLFLRPIFRSSFAFANGQLSCCLSWSQKHFELSELAFDSRQHACHDGMMA